MLLNPFNYHAPKTLNEAVEANTNIDKASIIAGGTFIVNRLKSLKKRRLKTPADIISLNKVKELKGISLNNSALTIGAMTTIAESLGSNLLNKDCFIAIKKAAAQIATTPIRNMATIGGNITCRYTWTELPAVLIALDAKLNFALPGNKENSISAEEFFKKEARTSDILKNITVKGDPNTYTSYIRAKKTITTEIPMLAVCIKTEISKGKLNNTRVAINTAVSFPKRDNILESFLNGKNIKNIKSEECLENIDNAIYEDKSNEYKEHMFKVCLKNAIQEILDKAK